MTLTPVDWAVIGAYFLLNLLIGFHYKNRAGKSLEEFFVSGRDVPWWLAGTSMVATTFAADTPLAVTGMVAKGGIAGVVTFSARGHKGRTFDWAVTWKV